MKVKVGVVGAGIIGLTSALKILESVDNVDVTILAESFTPQTTADVAVGLIEPYLIDTKPEEKLR